MVRSDRTERYRTVGVFPGEQKSLEPVRAFDTWIDARLGAVTTFVHAGVSPQRRQQFVDGYLTAIWEAGLTPILTWEPFDVGDNGSPVAAIADGRATECLEAWAKSLAEWVRPSPSERRELYFRPAHEMNGSWYPWSAGSGVTAAAYRRMWRRLYGVFRDSGVPTDRVHWLWCVNAETDGRLDLLDFYPGDRYVDHVGVDGYNFGDSQSWSQWTEPAEVFESTFTRLRTHVETPLTVPEFGCSSHCHGSAQPAAKAAWITDAFALFDTWDVSVACWFNMDKETDWSVFGVPGDASGVYPDQCTVANRPYSVYPSFRRGAMDYLGGASR